MTALFDTLFNGLAIGSVLMLAALGLDHERLTFRHAGRDYRLTDIAGKVVRPILRSPPA